MSSELNSYLICQHPSHAALAEIFTKKQYQKALSRDPAYMLIGAAPSRKEAVERVGSALAYASGMQDQSPEKLKSLLRTLLYGTL